MMGGVPFSSAERGESPAAMKRSEMAVRVNEKVMFALVEELYTLRDSRQGAD